jgi:hypothetical protein
LMQVADYDNLALRINELFSDTALPAREIAATYGTNNLINNAGVSDAIFSQAAIVNINGYLAGQSFPLTSPILATDRIVVIVDNLTLTVTTDYTLNFTTNVITFVGPIAAAVEITVYNKTKHTHGWGMLASVYPHPMMSLDTIPNSRIFSANVNNLIDKANIMASRVGSGAVLARIAATARIYHTDKLAIEGTIVNEVVPAYYANSISTVNDNMVSFMRNTVWSGILQGASLWTFADYNQARYFFNSGDELRCNLTMTGAITDPGYLNWNQVVTQMGTLIFGYNGVTQTGTGGTSTGIGFYNLSGRWQTIFTSAPPAAPYDGDATNTPVLAVPANYAGLVLVFAARYAKFGTAIGIEIQVTLDNSAFQAAQDIAGTVTFNAGYRSASTLINTSARYENTQLPAVSVTDTFTTSVAEGTPVPGGGGGGGGGGSGGSGSGGSGGLGVPFIATIAANQQELNLATWATANGWDGIGQATITIASGVYIWSDITTSAGLTTGLFPGGLTIINNGFIIGKGGAGGGAFNQTGMPGGAAVALNQSIILDSMNGYIAGGGGGGGGQTGGGDDQDRGGGGGGAGGGAGGSATDRQNRFVLGGAGGAVGAMGGNGVSGWQATGNWLGHGGQAGGSAGGYKYQSKSSDLFSSGGGGGRILPGVRTATVNMFYPVQQAAYGGGGGEPGAASNRSGGGGWGAAGGGGGAGGAAIQLNGFTVALSSVPAQLFGTVV